jgi:hypothetical protein
MCSARFCCRVLHVCVSRKPSTQTLVCMREKGGCIYDAHLMAASLKPCFFGRKTVLGTCRRPVSTKLSCDLNCLLIYIYIIHIIYVIYYEFSCDLVASCGGCGLAKPRLVCNVCICTSCVGSVCIWTVYPCLAYKLCHTSILNPTYLVC